MIRKMHKELVICVRNKSTSLEYEMNQIGENSKTPYETIEVTIEFGKIFLISLNRPDKLNAFNSLMYAEIVSALENADANPEVVLCCLTGKGPYFSSGNDLANYLNQGIDKFDQAIEKGVALFKNFVDSFINFKKPLVAFVNGPAIGISFTILGLFDCVYASDKAFFHAPFTQLALSPEGCSSYTFPRLMGHVKAAEILLFNRKLNAQDALERNLINEIIPHAEFDSSIRKKMEIFSQIPKNSLLNSREFLRQSERGALLEVNKAEAQLLQSRFESGEMIESVLKFLSKKSKL